MDRITYDTKDGIATMLDTYERLYALFQARHEAGYDRHERLNTFVILGRFRTDTCGNWWTMRFESLPPEAQASFAPVMTDDEFYEAVSAFGDDAHRYSCSSSTGPLGSLPPPQVTCTRCGKGGWTVENCHKFETESGFEQAFSLDPFVGKTLTAVEEALRARTDGIYALHATVRNDRWIDHKGRLGRKEGWRSHQDDVDPLSMDYVVAEGDETTPYVLRFYHASCHGELRVEDRAAEKAATIEGITLAFSKNGFTGVRVEEVPLPKHILDWMQADDPDEDLSDAAEGMTYLRVTSDQGIVGICMAVYPALDLTGTGVTIAELCPETDEMPPDMPQLCGFDGEPATMLKLWQLLVKKSRPA